MAGLKCLASMLNSISIMGITYEGWGDWSVFSASKPRCDWYLWMTRRLPLHKGARASPPPFFLLWDVFRSYPAPSLPLQRCTECCRKAQECHCEGYYRVRESVKPIPLKLALHTNSRQELLKSGILQRRCSRGQSSGFYNHSISSLLSMAICD